MLLPPLVALRRTGTLIFVPATQEVGAPGPVTTDTAWRSFELHCAAFCPQTNCADATPVSPMPANKAAVTATRNNETIFNCAIAKILFQISADSGYVRSCRQQRKVL